MTFNQILIFIYVIYLIVMSFVAFILFNKDKKMAAGGGKEVRIKEKTLLAVSAFGGAIGALVGRIVAHHKTDKKYFSFTIYLGILLQLLVLGVIIILAL